MSIKSVMSSNYLILCHPLLLLLSLLPSIRVFSKESVLHIRLPKYQSFSTSPSNGYSGLISFRIDWLDVRAVQGTLKSLPQPYSSKASKASIPQCSAFFIVQLSHPYMTTGKTIALTTWTFVCKVMSLLFPSMVLYLSNSPDKKIKLTLTGKVLHQPAVGSSSDLLWFTNYSPHIHRQSTDISYRPEVT